MNIDFNHLTLVQIIVTLFAITALDFVAGVGVAIKNHEFSLDRVAEFLSSHVLARVIPLSFAAAIGTGIPQVGLDPIPVVFGLFVIGAVAYVGETLASIAKNLQAEQAPTLDTSGASEDETPPPTS